MNLFRKLFMEIKLKSIGKNVSFARDIKIRYGKNMTIGNNVRVGFSCIFSATGGIRIGNNVALNCNFNCFKSR